mgnify:FL=1
MSIALSFIFGTLLCFVIFKLAKASKKNERILSEISDYRDIIKSHVLKHGTNDQPLYNMVIEKSRLLLEPDHPARKANQGSLE